MIEGIGIDLVKINRIEAAAKRWGDRFLQRVFTPREVAYCYQYKQPYTRLAARFAAKEAFLKALGVGLSQGISLQEIEVISDGKRRPQLHCTGRAQETLKNIQPVHLSLSHDSEYAIAQVLLVRNPTG